MRAVSTARHQFLPEWQRAVAAGFLVLIALGALVDHRNAVVDQSAAGLRPAERSAAPPTQVELVREMLAHD